MAASLEPSLVESLQLSQTLQGGLRRDGDIVESTFDKNSVAGYSLNIKDVSAGSSRISTVRSCC
jgi:hypothetical protein